MRHREKRMQLTTRSQSGRMDGWKEGTGLMCVTTCVAGLIYEEGGEINCLQSIRVVNY